MQIEAKSTEILLTELLRKGQFITPLERDLWENP